MGELESAETTGGVVAATASVLMEAVRYGILIAQLAVAGIKLRGLSERVRRTYHYVEGCSAGVNRLADQMAGLRVDRDTISEHRNAATVMQSVLADAEAMAAETEDLATLFDETSAAHQADYGPVAESIRAMPVPMADASFYSNR
ncbi:hypothetical protein GCM10023194_81140 [Planotetraspora phitsanulokensis]|uniref:Uncharacterized protein n=1 Tax=Planotetraspora phitsanulokensis TaxID=575192 RepID=A0A8J3UCE6_9ACTN|nr:hypothetical protein [Planotetraspora phitsanulokensis]GII42898.1 hypothetical protein Pph01_79010 [Planotetraspora phitsanulokensis]